MTRRRWIAAAACAAVLVAGLGTAAALNLGGFFTDVRPWRVPGSTATPSGGPTGSNGKQVVYVHYYMWWTSQHWRDKLGPAYPYTSASLPVPGGLDAAGCNPHAFYRGSQIVDLPTEGLYDQYQALTFEHHVDLAIRAGLKGFLVSWQGTGTATQGPQSSGYDSRLELLVTTVDAYNATHGTTFSLGLAFAAFGNYNRPAAQIIGDLTYFHKRYGRDPAFRNDYSPKPIVMWLDSRKSSRHAIEAVSRAVQPHVYLLGDETAQSWLNDGQFLDGTSYYWSTENPWSNAGAGNAVARLAAEVRNDGKTWFAPFIAGYNKQLLGGSCVPRNGTETLTRIWELNGATHPDGWFGISWNELVENTYLEPSRLYGTRYLDALSALIHGTATGSSATPTTG
jgi:hypothetical protein